MRQALVILLFFYIPTAFSYMTPSYSQSCYSPVEQALLFANSGTKKKKTGPTKASLRKGISSLEKRISDLEEELDEISGELGDSLKGRRKEAYRTAGKIQEYMENEYNGWECGKGTSKSRGPRGRSSDQRGSAFLLLQDNFFWQFFLIQPSFGDKLYPGVLKNTCVKTDGSCVDENYDKCTWIPNSAGAEVGKCKKEKTLESPINLLPCGLNAEVKDCVCNASGAKEVSYQGKKYCKKDCGSDEKREGLECKKIPCGLNAEVKDCVCNASGAKEVSYQGKKYCKKDCGSDEKREGLECKKIPCGLNAEVKDCVCNASGAKEVSYQGKKYCKKDCGSDEKREGLECKKIPCGLNAEVKDCVCNASGAKEVSYQGKKYCKKDCGSDEKREGLECKKIPCGLNAEVKDCVCNASGAKEVSYQGKKYCKKDCGSDEKREGLECKKIPCGLNAEVKDCVCNASGTKEVSYQGKKYCKKDCGLDEKREGLECKKIAAINCGKANNKWDDNKNKCLCGENQPITSACDCSGDRKSWSAKDSDPKVCKINCRGGLKRSKVASDNGKCVKCPKGGNKDWQNDSAFGKKGKVNKSFCKGYGDDKRVCKNALSRMKRLIKELENLQNQLEQKRKSLHKKELSMDDSEKKPQTSSLCIDCVRRWRSMQRSLSGSQIFGNILSTTLGGLGSIWGLNESRHSQASSNEMLALQGFPAENNFGYSLAGIGVGFPFMVRGMHGLAQGNASRNAYACSPTVSPYPYASHRNPFMMY